jgi:hypothetical protein
MTLDISTRVDYRLRRKGLQAQQGVDKLGIFSYNEHAAQHWLMVPGALVR